MPDDLPDDLPEPAPSPAARSLRVRAHVRTATAGDAAAIRTALSLAFHDNPMMRWALPDDGTRLEACAAWLGPSVDRYLALGLVHVAERDGRVVGAAAWRLHGVDVGAHPVASSLPTPAGALALILGADRAAAVLTALGGASTASAPTEPADYLNYLVVVPGEQGHGIGRDLVLAGIGAADARARDTWLCTTDPRNHAFYARLGYVELGRHELGPGGPGLVALARRRQSAAGAGPGSANQTTVSP
ncbi:GNAT family N-acetyltransferase [Cellulomonas chitinilytica]|nr:GNAT family N-acetyltransferase [Cellulomonas chitinilytica]